MNWKSFRPYIMVAPAMSIFLIFYIFPILYNAVLSMTNWEFLSTNKEYVGLHNYFILLHDKEFFQVIRNTFYYTFFTVSLGLCIAMILAVWLNRSNIWSGLIQGAIFSPYIVSMSSVAMIWLWMMNPSYGLLNSLLEAIGIPKLMWLEHPSTSLQSIILVSVWKQVGFYTLVLLAGLQSIPKTLYEAAALDYTPFWKQFYKITLPMLSPTIFFLIIIGMINSFQVFETISIMTQGGPINSTNTLVYHIYSNAFRFFKMGYASAAGVVFLAIISILTIIQFIFERKVHYR